MSDKPFNANIPFSQDAECAVIGSLLTNPNGYYVVADFLTAADFFLPRHRTIYDAIKRMHTQHDAVDYLTIAETLRQSGDLDGIGGHAYLLQLVNETPTSAHVTTYARLVQRAAYRRRLMKTAEDLRALAGDETTALEQVREKASRYFLETIDTAGERRVTSARDAALAYMELFERMVNHKVDMLGIPSGFPDIDKLTLGAQPGQMIVVAGRPGMGKTSYVIATAMNMARWGANVVIWSGEMSEEQYTHRFISALSDVELGKVKNPGIASDEERGKILDGANAFYQMSIVIDDTPKVTLPGLYLTALEYKGRGMMDVLMLDQIGLMAYPELDTTPNETLKISRLSTGLKNLAREIEVPVVVVSQLNRAVDQRADKRPMLSDLRQSGAIEQDADIVQFLYRDEVYNAGTETPNMCEVIIAKNRDGATGAPVLYFDAARATFKNAVRRDLDLTRGNGHKPAPTATHASKSEPF